MKSKLWSVLMFVVLLGFISSTAMAGGMNLRLGSPAPPNSEQYNLALQFAQNLDDLSQGTIHTEVIGGGVLGNPKQTLAQLRAGKLDFWFIPIEAPMFARECKEFFVLFAPFLFRDQDHYRRFLSSDVFTEMINGAQQKINIQYVGLIVDRAPRSLSTAKKPIASPDDMKGLKMRIPGLPFIADVWKAWGASPTPMKGSDTYQALQSGMVDGDDNGIATLFNRGLMEVLNYHTPINYVHSGLCIYASGTTWEKLNDQQQAWARKATVMVEQKQETYDQMMTRFYEKAKAKGITFVEPDMEKFQAPVEATLSKMDGKFWPKGMYQRIHNLP
jgi:TRAP-type transport system periplasmic protein